MRTVTCLLVTSFALVTLTGCGGDDKPKSASDVFISKLKDRGFDTTDRAGALGTGQAACTAMETSGEIDDAIGAVKAAGITDTTQARAIAVAAIADGSLCPQ